VLPVLSEGGDVIRFLLMRVATNNVVGVAMTTLACAHIIQCILNFDCRDFSLTREVRSPSPVATS